jgi:microtubule-associated protein-like 1/2
LIMSEVISLLSSAGPNVFVVQVNRSTNPFNTKGPNLSIEQVAQKLVSLGVNREDARTLARQDVDGEVLPYLTDDSLTKVGISTLGRRVKILKAAQQVLAPYQQQTNNSNNDYSSNSQPSLRSSSNRPLSANPRATIAADDEEDSEEEDNNNNNNRGGFNNTGSSFGSKERFNNTAPLSSSNRAKSGGGDNNWDSNANINSTSDDSEDDEREREYIRPQQKKIEMKRSSAPDAADDDLFGVEEAGQAQEFMAVKPWLGAIVAPSKPPSNNANPPDRKLRLEWAHGYRAFDSRSNLFYNAQGDVVYPVAGICVVYNAKTRKQKHFVGHNDDVRCLARHPKNTNIFASGQNASVVNGRSTAPYICVWDSTDFTKTVILKGVGTDRAIRALGFSGDGKYLATVSNDDNHTIKVWDWERKTLLTSVKGSNYPIYAIQGNHINPAEFVTVGKRHAVQWNFDGVKLSGKKLSVGGSKADDLTFFAVCFSEKGYTCIGGDDGQVYIFSGGKLMKPFTVHPGAKVTSLHWYYGGIVSGGSDNNVYILDKKLSVAKKFNFSTKISSVHISGDNLLVGTQGADVYEVPDYLNSDIVSDSKLDPITRGHSDGELWAIATTPDSKYFVTAGEDNTVALWDVQSHKMIRKTIISEKKGKAPKIKKASTTSTHPPNQCARAIAIEPKGRHIIIGCNNGEVVVFDARTMNKLINLDLNKFGQRAVDNQTGNWIQVMAYNPSGTVCAVGTHGSVVVLLDVLDGYKPKGTLTASHSFISHIDWSADGQHIQTNDGAYELLFYDIDESNLKSSRQNKSASALKDVKWATQTCCFGWPVQGIFDPSQDGSDINTCDSNANKSLIVTGDDFGNVNLFRYPVMKGNKSVSSHAHSSHVVRVRFTADERYVLSVGGHDLSVMQWAVV